MTDQNAPQQSSGQSDSDSQVPTQTSQPMSQQPKGTSGLAIAGLVLGIVAAVTAFVPIVNNASFFIAIIGLALAIAGRVQTSKGAKSGGGVAIAGIVLCIVALVVTLAVQAACSAALDSVTKGETGTVANSAAPASGEGASASGQSDADTSNMAVGQTVDMANGLSITVNSVSPGLINYDGSTVTGVTVTYVNNGTSGASFNLYDWKAEDANGAQRSITYYSEATDDLSSGTLSTGGTVTGNIYFDEPVVKVYYYSNLLSSDSDIAWNVG